MLTRSRRGDGADRRAVTGRGRNSPARDFPERGCGLDWRQQRRTEFGPGASAASRTVRYRTGRQRPSRSARARSRRSTGATASSSITCIRCARRPAGRRRHLPGLLRAADEARLARAAALAARHLAADVPCQGGAQLHDRLPSRPAHRARRPWAAPSELEPLSGAEAETDQRGHPSEGAAAGRHPGLGGPRAARPHADLRPAAPRPRQRRHRAAPASFRRATLRTAMSRAQARYLAQVRQLAPEFFPEGA